MEIVAVKRRELAAFLAGYFNDMARDAPQCYALLRAMPFTDAVTAELETVRAFVAHDDVWMRLESTRAFTGAHTVKWRDVENADILTAMAARWPDDEPRLCCYPSRDVEGKRSSGFIASVYRMLPPDGRGTGAVTEWGETEAAAWNNVRRTMGMT